jgi:hypothetical protein
MRRALLVAKEQDTVLQHFSKCLLNVRLELHILTIVEALKAFGNG